MPLRKEHGPFSQLVSDLKASHYLILKNKTQGIFRAKKRKSFISLFFILAGYQTETTKEYQKAKGQAEYHDPDLVSER